MQLSLEGSFDTAVNLLGPYEKWMFDIGKVFDLPALMLDDEVNLSCVAEFSQAIALDTFDAATKMTRPGGGRYWVNLPTLYRPSGFTARFLPFVVSPVEAGAPDNRLLNQTSADIQDFLVKFGTEQALPQTVQGGFRVNFPIRHETLDSQFPLSTPAASPPDLALNGGSPQVILAIIDLGIPFAHANFRHPGTTKTRIDFCWAQSAPVLGGDVLGGEVLFGREFRRDQIDQMVTDAGGDETAVYAKAGLLSQPYGPPMPLNRAHSHGSHTLDLLAGNWPADSAAAARIIAVDLPSSSVWETSGFGKDMFVLAALHYIFDRADRIKQTYGGGDLPLVINLSYGYSGGPHDGMGMIEAAMAELVAHRQTLAPTTLVMPAGNMFQDRLHAHLTDHHFTPDPQDATQLRATLQWFAPPNDRTSSYLEFWYPPGTDPADIRVEVTPPNEATGISTDDLPRNGATFFGSTIKVDGEVVGQLTFDLYRQSRWRVTVLMAPSETSAAKAAMLCGADQYRATPAGIWTLTFRIPHDMTLPEVVETGGGDPVAGGIAARIQRDSSYGQGNTGARQSYFIDPDFVPFAADGSLETTDTPAAKLHRFGSLNGMATDRDTLVAGGYVGSNGKAAPYASAGSLAGGAAVGKQVGIAALTERSPVLRGVVAAGTRSGTSVAFQGTSSASPQIARQLALMALRGDLGSGDVLPQLAASAQVTKVTDTGSDPLGQVRLGLGRLNTD